MSNGVLIRDILKQSIKEEAAARHDNSLEKMKPYAGNFFTVEDNFEGISDRIEGE